MELNKAEDCFLVMVVQPFRNRFVIVAALFIGLRQSPAAVLTAFNRDFQHLITGDSNQIIFRLVCAVLNGYIISISGEEPRCESFCGHTDMP